MQNKKVFIIAEAGVNHNGDIGIAKKLIENAAQAGVDAVKFQTFKADNLVTKMAPKASYQKETTGIGNQHSMLKKLELSIEQHVILKKACEDKGLIFISTPFDFESVDLLEKIDLPIYKISSGDLTNLPLIKYIAKTRKDIILSTGMANLGEVEEAVDVIKSTDNNITLLHCTSNYPTSFKDVNLNSMLTLKNAFKLPVGYSDHTLGIEVAVAAVALGAEIIEKHFTLDKNMNGPDHRASLNQEELMHMVYSIRNIEKALGDGIKKCNVSEIDTKQIARKSIVSKSKIKKGEVLTYQNTTIKRPEGGLLPKYLDLVIGCKATYDIEEDSLIKWQDIEF